MSQTQPSFSFFYLLESCALHMTTFPLPLGLFFFPVLQVSSPSVHLLRSIQQHAKAQGPETIHLPLPSPARYFLFLFTINFHHYHHHKSNGYKASIEAIYWRKEPVLYGGFKLGAKTEQQRVGVEISRGVVLEFSFLKFQFLFWCFQILFTVSQILTIELAFIEFELSFLIWFEQFRFGLN